MLIFNKNNLLLLVIFIVALLLRFYKIDQIPPSLTWDETAWGYNAYTLGIDGRDEFGRLLPIAYIESFGDFKPPMYAYLTLIPVKIFGLNEFSVRFPSAFFGTLTIIATFFLVKRIFNGYGKANLIALTSSFLLAISPWHINLSRAAFEANVANFLIVTGVWFFLEGVSRKRFFLIFSAICFALSLYTFNTARIVSPILVIVLGALFYKQILISKKESILAFIFGLILILPLIPFLLTPQAQLRFREVNIFSDIEVVKRANLEIENDGNAPWSKLIHNRRLAFGVEYLKHYLDHFNPSFLFVKGDGNPKFSTQDVGQMYLWELPFLILGTLLLLKKKKGLWFIIPLWLLIGILPAATARETPHALRVESSLPMFQILTAIGIVWFLSFVVSLKHFFIKKAILFSLIFISFLNFFYYVYGYYNHYPREFSGEWQYGYKESIKYVKEHESEYDTISITNNLGRAYIYYLFYTKTSPELFRNSAQVERDVFGFVDVNAYGKYVFGNENYSDSSQKVLYIRIPSEVPSDVRIIKEFKLLNNQVSLVAYEKIF